MDRLQRFARDRGKRHPAHLLGGGPLHGTLARDQGRRFLHDREGHHVGRAFANADGAADALAHLDGVLHHPREGPATLAPDLDPGRRRAAHIEGLDGADVHADAAVDAVGVVDVDAIAHGLPPDGSGRSSMGPRRPWRHARSGGRRAHPIGWAVGARWPGPSVTRSCRGGGERGRQRCCERSVGLVRQPHGFPPTARGRVSGPESIPRAPPGPRPRSGCLRGASPGCCGGGTWWCSRRCPDRRRSPCSAALRRPAEAPRPRAR